MKRLCKKDSTKTAAKKVDTKNPDEKKRFLTRKGVASLYIVIFATILFGVVTLSFMRIILSEAEQGSDDDLSRSAYDAAIAGVEDAKTAVNRYYNCLSSGTGKCSEEDYKTLFADIDCTDIDGIGLARYLYGDSYGGQEVLIQQNLIGSGDANNNSEQAYTCVVVSDVVPDYRGTLTSDTRTKVVPIGVYGGGNIGSNLSNIKKVEFSWYSQLNIGDASALKTHGNNTLYPNNEEKTVPPVVSLTLVRMREGTNITEFYEANNGADYATKVLVPADVKDHGESINPISYFDLQEAGNVGNSGNNITHKPLAVNCTKETAFACSVQLEGLSFGDHDSAFLIVSLPYGDTVTDFSVALYDQNNNTQSLKGVQVSVDSTGRTNDLVRRVEVRLDPADLFFPYPQYALELDGSGEESDLTKNFWVTANCWYSQPSQNNGTAQPCANYGEVKNGF